MSATRHYGCTLGKTLGQDVQVTVWSHWSHNVDGLLRGEETRADQTQFGGDYGRGLSQPHTAVTNAPGMVDLAVRAQSQHR